MTSRLSRYRTEWFASAADVRCDVLAGVVVALALIPEAIGFPVIAGADPRVRLYASVAIAISVLGRRPAMISAATAAVAMVATSLVRDRGVPYLLAATIPMGALRIVLPYSLTLAAMDLLEPLLTAQIVDDMTASDSGKRREC